MKTENYSYTLQTSKSLHDVYELLLDVKKWWFGIHDEKIKGNSRNIGDEFSFNAGGGVHNTTQKLIELIPDKRIVWLVTESNLSFLDNPGEWVNTKLSFDLQSTNDGSTLTFTHEGLTPKIECYNSCSAGWTGYMEKTGKNFGLKGQRVVGNFSLLKTRCICQFSGVGSLAYSTKNRILSSLHSASKL